MRDRQRKLNLAMMDVVKKEVIKLLDYGIIFPISDSEWVSPIQCVPKNGGITVIQNENAEWLAMRIENAWRVCMDYRKLNKAIEKYHYPLPFLD